VDLFSQSAAKIEKRRQVYDFQVELSSKRNVNLIASGYMQRVNLLTHINVFDPALAHTFAPNSLKDE